MFVSYLVDICVCCSFFITLCLGAFGFMMLNGQLKFP